MLAKEEMIQETPGSKSLLRNIRVGLGLFLFGQPALDLGLLPLANLLQLLLGSVVVGRNLVEGVLWALLKFLPDLLLLLLESQA